MSNIDFSYCENMAITGYNSEFFAENPVKTGLLGYKSGKMRNVGNRLREGTGCAGTVAGSGLYDGFRFADALSGWDGVWEFTCFSALRGG